MPLLSSALDKLPLQDIDLLIIENVGNLMCPAEFTLGEHKKVLVSSISEGDDKLFKSPVLPVKEFKNGSPGFGIRLAGDSCMEKKSRII